MSGIRIAGSTRPSEIRSNSSAAPLLRATAWILTASSHAAYACGAPSGLVEAEFRHALFYTRLAILASGHGTTSASPAVKFC